MKQILKLSNYINLNSKKFSLRIFNQRLPFIYIFFNFLYRQFLVNKKNLDQDIFKFHKSGYVKPNINLKDEIYEYIEKFNIKKIIKNGKVVQAKLLLNDEDKKQLIIKIKKKLKPLISKLENYFDCDVFIADVKLLRNYSHNDKYNLEKEHYANHFHQDSYLITYNKIFVNLMDINEDDGPLEIIPNEKTKLFIKSFNYKERHNYNPHGDKKLIYKNTGKLGDCFLFCSPRVFHRAGVPKFHRDNMAIIIVTIPKNKSKELNLDKDINLFDHNYIYFQKFTKPYSIIKVIKLFLFFCKNKMIKKK
jgi:hypothetical protein